MTTRLVLVPPRLLFTPQQFAVLVNVCRFTSTPSSSNGRPSIALATCRSSKILPPRTSPTSNATKPPGWNHPRKLLERPADKSLP